MHSFVKSKVISQKNGVEIIKIDKDKPEGMPQSPFVYFRMFQGGKVVHMYYNIPERQ